MKDNKATIEYTDSKSNKLTKDSFAKPEEATKTVKVTVTIKSEGDTYTQAVNFTVTITKDGTITVE